MKPPTPFFVSHVWLAAIFPLSTAAAMFGFGSRLGKSRIAWLCSASVGASFAFSAAALFQLLALPPNLRTVTHILFDWIPSISYRPASGPPGTFSAAWGIRLDPVSAGMMLVVTGVALLIHIYFAGHMQENDSYPRVFGCMNLMVFAVMILVLANNSLVFCAGWGALGLCGFLLIGLYFRRPAASESGKKMVNFNRAGNAYFLMSLKKLSGALGSFDGAVIDRAGVDGAGGLARAASRVSMWCDDWIVDGTIRMGVGFVRFLALPARLMQNGRVQSYILWFTVGLTGFLGYFAYLIHHAAR